MKHLVTTSDLPDQDATTLSLWQTARADASAASGFGFVAVLFLFVWLAFQWGFGNDAVMPWLSAAAFDAVDDRETWTRGIVAIGATALTAFTFWAVTQAFDAIVVLASLKLIPGLTKRLSLFLQRKGWVTPYDEMKWKTRWAIAYFTGVSSVMLVDLFATGEHGIARRKKMIVQSVLLSAGSLSLVVGLTAVAAVIAVRVPATADTAETFIRYARNPLTWIGLFGALFAWGLVFGGDDPDEPARDEVDEPSLPSAT